MAPNGVPILRPPANALPPGTEWQATQSPARAKYSPLLSGAAAPCACANAAAPSTNRAMARRFMPRKAGGDALTWNPPPSSSGAKSGSQARRRDGSGLPLARGDAGISPSSDAASGRARRQVVIHDRQAADAFAGDGEDRVRDRRHDRRRRGFADAAPGRTAARHDVDIDLRRLGEAHHAVAV